MIEGVFGSIETAYKSKTQCRLYKTRQSDVMLKVCSEQTYRVVFLFCSLKTLD